MWMVGGAGEVGQDAKLKHCLQSEVDILVGWSTSYSFAPPFTWWDRITGSISLQVFWLLPGLLLFHHHLYPPLQFVGLIPSPLKSLEGIPLTSVGFGSGPVYNRSLQWCTWGTHVPLTSHLDWQNPHTAPNWGLSGVEGLKLALLTRINFTLTKYGPKFQNQAFKMSLLKSAQVLSSG